MIQRIPLPQNYPPPQHVDWVTVEAASKGLDDILSTLWYKMHPLVSDITSLVRHNTRERRARVEWEAEYDIIPMNILCNLLLDLKTWYISVKEEAGDIDLISMLEIRFELDQSK